MTRGYWAWELAEYFPVDNFSANAWVEASRVNASGIDNSRCFPSEQSYCDEMLLSKKNDTGKSIVSRGGAGKSMQWIARLLMGSMYKFTLEIENKQIDGYITEKFYFGFLSRTLMVYCGAPNAHLYAPGDKSYIDCHDFEGPYELALHLQYLNHNHTAYLEYFDWKKRPLRPEFVDLFRRSPLQAFDQIHDLSVNFLDAKAWTVDLKKSLREDRGWPQNTEQRSVAFQKWSSDEWRQNREEFVQERVTSGETWMCEVCKQVARDRNISF